MKILSLLFFLILSSLSLTALLVAATASAADDQQKMIIDEKTFASLDNKLHQSELREIVSSSSSNRAESTSSSSSPSILHHQQQQLIDGSVTHHYGGHKRLTHKCMHDDEDHQKIVTRHLTEHSKEFARANGAVPKDRTANTLAIAGIRVVVSDADLDDTNKHCTAEGQTRPDFKGGTTTCRAEDILTAEKKNILRNKVLPDALNAIKAMIGMEPLTSPIIVPATACAGLGYTIPTSHSTSGVPDAEYVLYVSAGRTPDGVIAFAGGCGEDADGRIIYGRANFGPEYLKWDDGNPAANDDLVKTGVHEIWHALGASYSTYNSAGLVEDKTVRGKTTKVFKGAIAAARAREHFACATLTTIELEDEGGSGSALSHPDKRLFAQDFMAASGGTTITPLSIAMLADLGHYTPLYGNVQNATFGRDAGCGFIEQKCNVNAGGRDEFFCFDASLTDTCNYDFTASGFCTVSEYSSDLPAYFQYFAGQPRKGGNKFYDYCPTIQSYSNRICNGERSAPHIDYVLGFTFTRQSRCFRSEGVVRSGFSNSGVGTTRCLVSRCIDNGAGGKAVQFRINGSSWIECSTEGQSIGDLPGYDGRIICPQSFADFCTWYDKVPAPPDGFPQDFAGTGASGSNDPYNQVPTNTGAIIWIIGELVFTGQGFSNVSDKVPTETVRMLQRDIAGLIGLSVREAFITSARIEPHPNGKTSERVLKIKYHLTNIDLTLETVSSRFENVRKQNSTAWLSRTRTQYAADTKAFDSPLLYSHQEDYELDYFERLFLGLGIGPFSGVVVAGFIFVCIIVAIIFCFCKDSLCPNADGASTDGGTLEPSSPRKVHQHQHAPPRKNNNNNNNIVRQNSDIPQEPVKIHVQPRNNVKNPNFARNHQQLHPRGGGGGNNMNNKGKMRP